MIHNCSENKFNYLNIGSWSEFVVGRLSLPFFAQNYVALKIKNYSINLNSIGILGGSLHGRRDKGFSEYNFGIEGVTYVGIVV